MAVVLRRNQIGVQAAGVSVSVPDDCRARLMYYLNCMCVVLNLENKERLSDYQRYYLLTHEEEKDLLFLCLMLSPEVLEGKCIFLNEEACGDSQNEFVNVQSVSTTLAAVESVVVGERNVQVKRIMFYKVSWILGIYFQPIALLMQRLKNAGTSVGASGQRAITYGETAGQSTYQHTSSGAESDSCCCTIL